MVDIYIYIYIYKVYNLPRGLQRRQGFERVLTTNPLPYLFICCPCSQPTGDHVYLFVHDLISRDACRYTKIHPRRCKSFLVSRPDIYLYNREIFTHHDHSLATGLPIRCIFKNAYYYLRLCNCTCSLYQLAKSNCFVVLIFTCYIIQK